MYDHALWRAKSFLQAHDIAFVPGLNEDLAATAVWGSQQVGLFPGAKVDGVFGIWYGKGPGVDRSVDVFKHANSAGIVAERRRARACRRRSRLPVLDAGASERAGVRRGADAGAQSGDAAGLSRPRPLRLCAVALLRLLGRLQGDRRDGRELGVDLQRSGAREDRVAGRFRDAAGRPQHPLARPAARSRKGGCTARRWTPSRPSRAPTSSTKIVLDSKPARLGIIATGKAYLDLRQALADLGISDARRRGSWACASTRSR